MSQNLSYAESSAPADPPLPQGYWVRLTGQMDRLQAALDDLAATAEAGGSQTAALLRHLTDPGQRQVIEERLAELIAGQEAAQTQWQALAERLTTGLNELTQAVARLNRTQFKSNTLAEMKDQQVTTALETLQDVATRREQAQETRGLLAEARAAELRSEARGEFAADLLPALDGLEMALESGQALLTRQRAAADEAARTAQSAAAATGAPGFWQRLAWAVRGRGLPPGFTAAAPAPVASAGATELIAALAAWLEGLAMVRARFLGLLATADIYPIQAEGQPFDPRQHLAMATTARADLPGGAVATVLRKGYRQRDRVLRYAEVVVNRPAEAPADADVPMSEVTPSAPSEGYLRPRLQPESDET